ncbi:MAG: ABC transporter ATP-binding protein [Candidatus Wallbacteria bacterium]|nr:ABC transporter ATP-binding protein [Candidatus Wallbacteria bacterium]
MEVIRTEKLVKIYDMGKVKVEALKGVDILINKGEMVAIMGKSGSGKTTLLDILGLLSTPTSGTYILNNQNVSSLSDEEMAGVRNREIGFVFQTFNLLPRVSAAGNVELPLIYSNVAVRERRERALEALSHVGLSERGTHLPAELSGGQRQRVAIARALINNPAIILADEPTGNLDTKSSYEIMEILKGLHEKGNTIILVTHEHDIAAYAQRTIFLRDGMVVEGF